MYPCVEVTISESTYATFYYADQAYEIPEGVTAYAAIKNESDITLDEVPVYINAGCPVVLNGEPGTYQFKWTDITTPYTRPNDLIGSEEGGTFGNDGAKYYVLSWKNKNKNIDEVGASSALTIASPNESVLSFSRICTAMVISMKSTVIATMVIIAISASFLIFWSSSIFLLINLFSPNSAMNISTVNRMFSRIMSS